MKLRYKNINLTQLFFLLIANLVLVSCGTYQNTSYNDGIYDDDEVTVTKNKKVLIVDEKEYDEYEENYFLKKLDSLNNIGNNDVFTNVDDYNTVDTIYIDEENIDENVSYNPNQPWGQGENNQAVVNVNLINSPYWIRDYGYANYGYGFYDTWGYRNWRNRGFYGWNQNPFWHPYQNYYAWNVGFYNPYYSQFNYF